MSSDETKTKYVLELDSKQFIENTAEAKEHLLKLGDAENLEGLITGFAKVSATIGVIGVALYGLKSAMEAVFEAENIKAVNAQFEILAKNAGISGTALKESLSKAADGLINETDLLKIANSAMLNMGGSAKRLGELMEASRKIAAGLGKDAKTVFEDLSRAIEYQNQKMFKSVGLNIDVEKAFKKYADTIGVGVAVLSQAEKQAALLNATLDLSKSKLGDGVGGVKQATTAWTQFKVALSEIGESLVLLWDKTVGPTITKVFKGMSDAAHGVKVSLQAAFGDGAAKSAAQLEALESKLRDTEGSIKRLQEIADNPIKSAFAGDVKGDLEAARLQAEGLRKEIAALRAEADASDASGGTEPDDSSGAPAADLVKRREAETKYQQESLQLQSEDLKLRMERARSEVEVESQFNEQRIMLEAEAAEKIAKIDDDKLLSAEQKANLRHQVGNNLATALVQDEEKVANAQIAAADRALAKSVTVGDQMANAARSSALKQEKAWKDAGGVGGVAFQALSTHAAQAFQQIGEGTKSGADIMKGFFLGAIGDMAMFTGQFMMGSAFKTWPYVDPVLLGEGGALVALGGFLHGMAGGGSSSSAGGLSSGGGGDVGGAAGSVGLDLTAHDDNQAQSLATAEAQKKKSVTIQVMGSYFETDETKRRLMDIIREYQDATDYRFIQIGHT